MKKTIRKGKAVEGETNDILPEYDFRNMKGGVRGKYSKSYRDGHTVKIYKVDGTSVKQHFSSKLKRDHLFD